MNRLIDRLFGTLLFTLFFASGILFILYRLFITVREAMEEKDITDIQGASFAKELYID